MCGIAGCYFFHQHKVVDIKKLVYKMIYVQRHRGPDALGVWCDKGLRVGLGHARLKIIDLRDRSNQPMISSCGKYIITFNGEIYNYLELREMLQRHGVAFRTNSDTEVLLYLYKIFGVNCLRFLRGMFAFAIFDVLKQQLFLARDRLGEKPLYYSVSDNVFMFSSEMKGILASEILNKKISWDGLAHFLAYNYCAPPPYTLIDKIFKLRPGYYLLVHGSKVILKRYWPHGSEIGLKKDLSLAEALNEYTNLIMETVFLETRSDVPISLMLSGGIDSTTTAIILSLHNYRKIPAFLIRSSKEEDPELQRAKKIAKTLGIPLFDIKIDSASGLDNLKEVVRAYDEPFNVYPATYALELYKRIALQHKVVFSGNGADEIFGGYAGYNAFLKRRKLFRFLPIPQELSSILSRELVIKICSSVLKGCDKTLRHKLLDMTLKFLMWKAPVLKLLSLVPFLSLLKNATTLVSSKYLERVLQVDVSRLITEELAATRIISPLDAKLWVDLKLNHIHGTVMIADGCAMRYALEVRNPFLDYRLVEFAFSLPDRFKIPVVSNQLYNKYIMKKMLSFFLSKDQIFVPKMGFGYGINWLHWLMTVWFDRIQKLLLDGWAVQSGLVDFPTVKILLSKERCPPIDSIHNIIWMLLNLEVWGRNYNVIL